LLILNPQYNEYVDKISIIEPGVELIFPNLRLARIARIAVEGPPGAIVLIDGEMYGRIRADGKVNISYVLPESQATEHSISVEKKGFHPWSKLDLFTPSVLTYQVKLEPGSLIFLKISPYGPRRPLKECPPNGGSLEMSATGGWKCEANSSGC
jgi:hypothetical protein